MLRELNETDLPAVLDLCAKGYHREPTPWTMQLVRDKTVDDLDFEPALLLGYEENGEVLGFAQGVVRDWLGKQRAWIRLMAVNPAWWGQGIGTALLKRMEELAKERGSASLGLMAACPNYLTPGFDFKYTEALCFARKHGYERISTNLNLMCDLQRNDFADCDAKIVEALQRGITVKRAERDELPMLCQWADETFPAWKCEIEACYRQDPISLWIALEGDVMLGFAAYDSNNVNTGHFGPTGMSPAARGKGVGALVTRLALRDMKRQGHRQSVIPWVGPTRFYEKCCGAWTDRMFWECEKTL